MKHQSLQNFTLPSSLSSLAVTWLVAPLSSSVLKRRYVSVQNELINQSIYFLYLNIQLCYCCQWFIIMCCSCKWPKLDCRGKHGGRRILRGEGGGCECRSPRISRWRRRRFRVRWQSVYDAEKPKAAARQLAFGQHISDEEYAWYGCPPALDGFWGIVCIVSKHVLSTSSRVNRSKALPMLKVPPE